MPLHRYIRTNFFSGQLLTAEDFKREQDYHRDKGRLRNRLLLGAGVVSGLRVSTEGEELLVSPGVAIDRQGNELVLPEFHRQCLTGISGRQFVTIRYVEIPMQMVPSPDGSAQPAAIEEAVLVELRAAPVPTRCDRIADLVEGPTEPPPLCLAAVTLCGARWRVRAPRAGRLRAASFSHDASLKLDAR